MNSWQSLKFTVHDQLINWSQTSYESCRFWSFVRWETL